MVMKPQPVMLSGKAGTTPLPLSMAMIAGNLVFTSGLVGWDLETRVASPSVEAQTTQTLENLRTVLEAAGTSLEYVVKTTVYLANIQDFEAMNQVYRRYFPAHPPARTTVGVKLAREDLLVEMDMVALLPEAGES
jgi:2-iminobutanoate/2-iminopropanoate deaminase